MEFPSVKEKIKLSSDLLRIRNCLMGFFGVIVAAVFISPENIFLNINILLGAFSVFLIMGAGNMINDYFDFEIDKINKPFRPIPSGRINRSDTLMISLILFFLGIVIAKTINPVCFVIAILNSFFLIFYGKYSKKLLFVSNFGVSYLVSSIFIFGAFVPTGLEINPEQIGLLTILTACAFLITFSREIIKDIEDVEGDRERYAITLATKFGQRIAKHIAILFALTAIIFSLFPFFFLPSQFFYFPIYAIFIGIADTIFLISLTMHPSLSQRMMVFGMLPALIAFFLGRIFPIYF